MLRTIFAAIGFCISSVTWAIADDNPCVELSRVIGLNYAKNLSVDQQQIVTKADLCSESYSSASSTRQAQLQASYKLFSGSASASADEVQVAQSSQCGGQYGEYWRNQIASAEGRTVSAEGASVIAACFSLTSDALYPVLEVANFGREITFAMQYRPTTDSTITISQFGPTDLRNNDCTVTKRNTSIPVRNLGDVVQTLGPTKSLSMSCHRRSTVQQINGVENKCTDETIFNIATSGPVKAIKIPRTCEQMVLPSRADRIEDDVKALRTAIANRNTTVDASLATLRGVHLQCVEQVANGATATCDAGFVATGCSAGYNYGSHSIDADQRTCRTDQSPAGQWTRAHCCKIIPSP
jgi:Resistin